MKAVTRRVYVADDGTEFADRMGCILYEEKQQLEEILSYEDICFAASKSIIADRVINWHRRWVEVELHGDM